MRENVFSSSINPSTMENQPSQLDKAVKISIIAGALIVALSFAYYLVIFLPKKETMRIAQQQQEQQVKEQKDKVDKQALEKEKSNRYWALEGCLNNADSAFFAYAKLNGTENTKTGVITASNDVWDRADKTKQAEKANCYRKFPQ